MTPEDTIKLFHKGRDAWNAWANEVLKQHPDRCLDPDDHRNKKRVMPSWLEGAKVVFQDIEFREDVDLSAFIFPHDVVFKNISTQHEIDLTNADFGGTVTFSGGKINGQLTIAKTEIPGELNLVRVKFFNIVRFKETRIAKSVSLTGCEFHRDPLWEGLIIGDALQIHSTKFHERAHLNKATLKRVSAITKSDFKKSADIEWVDLSGTNVSDSNLKGSNFSNSNLCGTYFSRCDLTEANLLGVDTDTETKFDRVTVTGCHIDSYALECLDDYGGLSKGARMKMIAHNDVSNLRRNFSGYIRTLHYLALAIFFFPYAWFLFDKWGQARFSEGLSPDHISIGSALWNYIRTGGNDWVSGSPLHWTAFIFAAGLLFNGFRMLMLWKTKSLEFEQEVRGLPLEFSLKDPALQWKEWAKKWWCPSFIAHFPRVKWLTWGTLQTTTNIMIALFLPLALFNCYHFFTMQVPTTDAQSTVAEIAANVSR